jgi:choline dehydrogenase
VNSPSFEYIVIGAGSAGCVLANRLSTLGSVLLLEAGGPEDASVNVRIPAAFSKLFKTSADWDFESGPEPGAGGRHLYVPRGRILGGSSAINAMIYIRGRPSDYEGWEQAGAEGWGWQAVEKAFLEVEDNSRGSGPHHAIGGELRVEDLADPSPFSRRFVEGAIQAGIPANPDFNGPLQEGVGLFQVNQRRGRRWSASDAFLTPVRTRPTLEIVTGALVERVLIEKGRATGVVYHREGKRITARAEAEVVVAAGAIGSPALLQRSGIGDPDQLRRAGVDPVIEAPGVGENLQDHPVVMLISTATSGPTLDEAETLPNLMRYLIRRRGPLTSNVGEAGAFVRSSRAGPEPDLQFHFAPAYFADHGFTEYTGRAYTTGPLLLNPASRGWVRIRNADPTSKPEIVGNHLTEPEDLPPLVEGLEIGREIFSSAAFAPVRGTELLPGPALSSEDDLRSFVRERVELLYHPVGTCRMGGEDAVVDPRLQVRGVTGLRVADASVMPRLVSGNTNAPTIMIATRAARMITEARHPSTGGLEVAR